MKRLLAISVLVAAVAAAVVSMGAGGGGGGSYKVRAIFDNAGFVIPGEDVKIAGVKVGKIDSLDVTPDDRAAVVLDITEPGYQDFRQDADCRIRPQSLIGERFVECNPTQAHPVGQQPPPPLKRISSGPGKGQYLLPVRNTTKPVDLDLINDIMRRPESERLSLILNELGTGLAGRGRDLNDVIRRADPALKETDRVLQILASQNRTLQELARNSDTVLAPLAAKRRRVASAIRNSSAVAEATAERRGALEADIQRLPPFLAQLKPTMVRLGALSDEMTPVLTDLGDAAPDINRLLLELGPFSRASIPAFKALGETAKVGTPAMRDARPVITQLRGLAAALRPVGRTGAAILESFQKTRGIERAMDYVFYQSAAINGFDSIGHYLRAGLIVNACSNYATDPVPGCSSNFTQSGSASSATAAAASAGDPVLLKTALALRKALAAEARKGRASARRTHTGARSGGGGQAAAPAAQATPAPAAQPAPAAAQPAPASGPSRSDGGLSAPLLDYLFGKDGG